MAAPSSYISPYSICDETKYDMNLMNFHEWHVLDSSWSREYWYIKNKFKMVAIIRHIGFWNHKNNSLWGWWSLIDDVSLDSSRSEEWQRLYNCQEMWLYFCSRVFYIFLNKIRTIALSTMRSIEILNDYLQKHFLNTLYIQILTYKVPILC